MYLTQTINNSSLQNITNYIFRRDIDDEETTAADSTIHMQPSLESDCEPVSLEGFLQCRMGKSSGHSSLIWKRKFVYFSFADGGSITVYKDSPNFDVNKIEDSGVLRSVYNKLSRNGVHKGHRNVDYDITPDLPWIAKDVERDSATFVVEIPTSDDDILSIDDVSVSATTVKSTGTVTILRHDDLELESDDDDDKSEDDDSVRGYLITSSTADCDDSGVVDYNEMQKHESFSEDGGKTGSRHDLRKEMATAKTKGKPLRIYFRCEKGSNEKALWLRAFATFGRLSSEYRKQRGIINALTAPLHLNSSNARIRSKENAFLARDTRNLDLTDSPEDAPEADITSVEQLVLGKNPTLARDKEFRVIPAYAYPHRWMTLSEMREEMVLSSEHFHDLRVPDCTGKVIGSLKVEVLQCLGLPKLDRARETDAVVYLVCGEYSFCTDVIPNRQNPMWLRKSRRACNIPIFHGYASLYVGVFDYEPKKAKDEFAGRVEINLSKLRPGSVYDVTLPLRLSKHVYSRRKRGAIRLRFSLNWKSERDVLMSYIPRKIRIPLPQNTTFRHDVSVRCTDPKAFRNIAITVHGSHLPGRFTFVQMRAAIREINFTRKYVLTSIRQNFGELRRWQHPALSAYVFFSWMHCIYANQFSLAPAYTVLFFLIILMCNYMKYNTDEPGQDGFIPPSWEEMFMALLRGHEPGCRNIEPLELIPRKCNVKKKSSNSINEKFGDVNVSTHTPKGKDFMKFLGLIPTKPRNADEEHLEFPFANGSDYPKFSIKECLAHRKGDVDGAAFVNQDPGGEFLGCNDIRGNNLSRFSIDMDLHDLRRKDSSGTKEYDEEEMNFNAAKAVLAKGSYLPQF